MLDAQGLEHRDDLVAEEGAVHAHFEDGLWQDLADFTEAAENEAAGTVAVVDVPGTVPHIEHRDGRLPGVGLSCGNANHTGVDTVFSFQTLTSSPLQLSPNVSSAEASRSVAHTGFTGSARSDPRNLCIWRVNKTLRNMTAVGRSLSAWRDKLVGGSRHGVLRVPGVYREPRT